MSVPFPEPTTAVESRSEMYLGDLEYFRDQVISRLAGMSEQDLRHSRLHAGHLDIVAELAGGATGE